ncbi:MAG TPA: TerC family protein [Bryobacteraceae bacterium]|nr:TerC family protein [Bryobacteraceae bacterium]
MHFVLSILAIVLIDLSLAGDNALVIALAVRALPKRQRRIGSLLGASAAVALRVGLTFIAARLLDVEFVKLAGGVFVLWIAIKVLRDASDPPEAAPSPARLAQAIWYIVVADITMSTDNILAIAGASKGNPWLMFFGLALSIPFVVISSHLLVSLMERFRWLVYLGAAVLGQVSAEMIFTDPFVIRTLRPGPALVRAVEAALAVALFAAGWAMPRLRWGR